MKNFKEFLFEKTFNFDKDIDYLYKESKMDLFHETIKNKDIDYIENTLRNNYSTSDFDYEFLSISSNKLKNRNSNQASKIKPVLIRVGMFNNGSFYNPNLSLLQISLNIGAFKLLREMNFNTEDIINMLNKQSTRFYNEFSSASFNGTAAHELTHWVDDVLHNSFISKRIKKAAESGTNTIKGKSNNVNHTNFEINSQIHAIKRIRNEYTKKNFDSITWSKLFQIKSSIMSNFKDFRNEYEYTQMINSFVKRLHREKLLPKSMKKIPSYNEMRKILRTI